MIITMQLRSTIFMKNWSIFLRETTLSQKKIALAELQRSRPKDINDILARAALKSKIAQLEEEIVSLKRVN